MRSMQSTLEFQRVSPHCTSPSGLEGGTGWPHTCVPGAGTGVCLLSCLNSINEQRVGLGHLQNPFTRIECSTYKDRMLEDVFQDQLHTVRRTSQAKYPRAPPDKQGKEATISTFVVSDNTA